MASSTIAASIAARIEARHGSTRRMFQIFLIAWDCACGQDYFLDLLGYRAIALKASSDNDCDRRAHFAVKLFQAPVGGGSIHCQSEVCHRKPTRGSVPMFHSNTARAANNCTVTIP
jgi:hypothetical protein